MIDTGLNMHCALITDVFKNDVTMEVYFCCSNSCYDAFAGDVLVSKI